MDHVSAQLRPSSPALISPNLQGRSPMLHFVPYSDVRTHEIGFIAVAVLTA